MSDAEGLATKKNVRSAVVFDLDNSLVDTYGVYRSAKLKLSQKIKESGGKIIDDNKFVDELFRIDREFCKRYNTWNYDQAQLVAEACKMAELENCNVATLTEDYKENLKKFPQLFPKTKETIETLKKNGTYLVLFSEGSENERKMNLEDQGIDNVFDLERFVGRKDEKYLQEIMQKLHEMGFLKVYCVGDSIRKDIRLGNSLGMETVWIPSKWEAEGPEGYADWPNHKINKIEDILSIIK
jgi:FMN phosphatase YigB (HAD superfamily)